ncbi:MAG: ELM1/GtrOC1 family putative glycosyltransferase [Pikeienuella sp.]
MTTSPPLIWALTGRNSGDNAQALALASAVASTTGGTVREVPLRFNLWREWPWLGASLRSLKGPAPSPPWPDMVIGVGRRAVPVARWIQNQSPTRLVWIGRPRVSPGIFDLVLTTPQYGVPDATNVMRLALPFAEATPPSRPVAPVLVIGGHSWACRLTNETVTQLATAVKDLGQHDLRITTSPRTPPEIAQAIAERLPGATFHRFGQGTNPYRQWLSEADACYVTGDSVSLIADAVATGAPTHIIAVPPARLLHSLASMAPKTTQRWLVTGGNRTTLAPPPNPDAVISYLMAKGVGIKTPYGATITGARDIVSDQHAMAVKKVVSLLR